MTDEPTYEYAAFVSYRRLSEDRSFAEWLVDALESFETPDRLAKEGYPARFGKVFRDDDELGAEPALTPAIRRALWASRYLLVVCSPETPRSAWVRAEISMFQHCGRGDRIIPVLIDGDPGASFPPELRRMVMVGEGPDAEFRPEEPRGPTLTPEQGKTEEELKERALLTIAASLLGCAYGDLRDRFEERVRRLTTTELYEQVEWRRGAPVGIGPVDEETASRRHATWRFESRGGRVTRLLRVNGSGHLAPDDEGVTRIDILYREDGGVEQVTRRDRHDGVKTRERYNVDQSIVDFIHEDDSAAPAGAFASGVGFNFEADSALNKQKSMVLRHLLDSDSAGLVVRKRFCRDTFNTPGQDGLGHYGQGFERDARGLAVRSWALDANGAPMTQRNGVAAQTSVFDDAGRKIETAYRDADGNLHLADEGYARATAAYDAQGNQIECACFGVHGAPTLHKEGYAHFSSAYDARGNLIEEAYFGVDGAPTLRKDGYARVTAAYDARGNRISNRYFTVNGAPAARRARWAEEEAFNGLFGEWQGLILRGLFAEEELEGLAEAGFAAVERRLDPRGHEIERRYTGPDGEPANGPEGFHHLALEVDGLGNPLHVAPTRADGEQPLRMRFRYNARRQIERVTFLDADERPATSRLGFASVEFLYDARAQQSGARYHDAAGALLQEE